MLKKVIYLADDLTGACDTASYICDYTGETEVILNHAENRINKSWEIEDSNLINNFVISISFKN